MVTKMLPIFFCMLYFVNFIEVAGTKLKNTNGETLLFTPGPVTTRNEVREAMNRDVGFKVRQENIRYLRNALLEVDGLSKTKYTAVLLQGSGTFNIEAAIQTATPIGGRVLILRNGYFGDNIQHLCEGSKIEYDMLYYKEGEALNTMDFQNHLQRDSNYSAVAVVHHETSTGILNPILELGKIIQEINPNIKYIVDAVSSFGCYPIPMDEAGIDFVISTPNKCIESVPGLGFNIIKKETLFQGKDNYRSEILNLVKEYEELETVADQRFTYAIQSYLAFQKAMELYKIEGKPKRFNRYYKNSMIIRKGMKELKFKEFLDPLLPHAVVVTTYAWPTNDAFNSSFFFKSLEDKNMQLYPHSLTETPIMRVGHIGQLTEADCKNFLKNVKSILKAMKVDNPNPE